MTHLVDAPAGHQVSGQEQLDGTSWTVRVGKVAGTTPMGAAGCCLGHSRRHVAAAANGPLWEMHATEYNTAVVVINLQIEVLRDTNASERFINRRSRRRSLLEDEDISPKPDS